MRTAAQVTEKALGNPAQMMRPASTTQWKENEITQIILQRHLIYLPNLKNEVVLLKEYARQLYDEGFDSMELLEGGYFNVK